MTEPIQDKVQKLAATLFKSGIAASESEAKRMAQSMVQTEKEVNDTFKERTEQYTKKEEVKQYGVNPVDGSPVNIVPNVNTADMDFETEFDEKINENESTNAPASPEALTASHLEDSWDSEESSPNTNISTDEQMEFTEQEMPSQESIESNNNFSTNPDVEEIAESNSEPETKDLPNLNPLGEEKPVEKKGMSDEERKRKISEMPESKIDLSKIFKV